MKDSKESKVRIEQIDKEIRLLEAEKQSLIKEDKLPLKLEQYKNTYAYGKLMEKHSLDEYGTWEVKGEDPNCDLGGYHHQPHLGFFKGTLESVLNEAVVLPSFWVWGGGGSITKKSDDLIIDLDS